MVLGVSKMVIAVARCSEVAMTRLHSETRPNYIALTVARAARVCYGLRDDRRLSRMADVTVRCRPWWLRAAVAGPTSKSPSSRSRRRRTTARRSGCPKRATRQEPDHQENADTSYGQAVLDQQGLRTSSRGGRLIPVHDGRAGRDRRCQGVLRRETDRHEGLSAVTPMIARGEVAPRRRGRERADQANGEDDRCTERSAAALL